MTTQEAYETMREWLTRPGATRAVLGNSSQCMYITTNGNKCAVGCLLSDDTLDQLYEVYCAYPELHDEHEVWELEEVDTDFLVNAQRLHDSESSWETGKFNVRALDRLARVFGLKVVRPLYVPRAWCEREPVLA